MVRMEFWEWLLLGLLVAVVGAGIWLRRIRARNAGIFAAETTPQRAAAASARLSEQQHREVYRHLAANNVLAAAQVLRTTTGSSIRDSLLDAQALGSFPQVWKAAASATGGAETTAGNARDAASTEIPRGREDAERTGAAPVGADDAAAPEREGSGEDEPEQAASRNPEQHASAGEGVSLRGRVVDEGRTVHEPEWLIPEDWTDEYGGEVAGERHMEFTHHDGTQLRRFSTQDMPAAQRDQLMSQLRDGDTESAARIIAEKVGLEEHEIEAALRANHESGNDRVDGIAVRFDRGDGEAVEFSTQELSDDERSLFVSAMQSDDLVTAAQVVSRHTGISPEQALSLLETFRRRRE